VEVENESDIIVAQGLGKRTKLYATEVLTAGTDIKCRMCQQYEEVVGYGLGKRT